MSGDTLLLNCYDGQIEFKYLENGELQIEIFAQDIIRDTISKDQTDQLAKWLVSRMI